MPGPTAAERARTLLACARVGTLTTFTSRPPVRCATTLVELGSDEHGRPLVSLAPDSPAVQRLRIRPLATVTVAPQGNGPLVVHGGARQLDAVEGQAVFRIEIGALRLLDGTGSVDPASYASAVPDPLRAEAPEILRHLDEGHSAELLACVRAHLSGSADWVVPVGLDRYGLTVTALELDGVSEHRLDFARPVSTLDELQAGLRATLRCRC